MFGNPQTSTTVKESVSRFWMVGEKAPASRQVGADPRMRHILFPYELDVAILLVAASGIVADYSRVGFSIKA